MPALTKAGIAHQYFESIHPFEDGNDRIGLAISEKALAQSTGQLTLTGLAATILIRRKLYYAELEAANKLNNPTQWLCWFAGIAIEAQRRTEANVEFLIDKTRLLDRLSGVLNGRQEKAILRILREGPEGFKGGLSAGNYSGIGGASPATATRDLAGLVEHAALVRTGERRHALFPGESVANRSTCSDRQRWQSQHPQTAVTNEPSSLTASLRIVNPACFLSSHRNASGVNR